jgi:MoxR-like ATPase
MPIDSNLNLYRGNGKKITDRNQSLPDFEPFWELEDPKNYIPSDGLSKAVNIALALGQPLLVTGEPGTGKTQLATSIAHELDLPTIKFYTKTTSTADDLFYQYDALRRFQEAQISHTPKELDEYITYCALGKAILLTQPLENVHKYLPPEDQSKCPTRSVVLIDEVDKAPRDFPNDILNEIDKLEFRVKETGKVWRTEQRFRPIVILTSNSEKNLPDAFLRRCIFYHIEFPSPEQLKEIVLKKFKKQRLSPQFIETAVEHFEEIREWARKKKPATAEFLNWLQILQSLKIDFDDLEDGSYESLILSYSVLAKTNEDLAAIKDRLAKKMETT